MTEQEIYVEAMNREDAAERGRFLDEACGQNRDLRARLEKLFQLADRVGDFLEQPPAGLTMTAEAAVDSIDVGTQIGPYRICDAIGEGGFAVVFLAEQSAPVLRKVALKVIKPGMDTRQVIARFEAERQALAMMDHPNIAKVFDAGATENGRPYFVMELVQGVPITEYCDQCNLHTRERLELFITVCQAVQHAHQKGVIHRDIKPTNVLVAMQDGRPAPKIIDFGVAKAIGEQSLTERTLTSAFAQMVGTPMYMSPEQAELSPLGVDTRSDIYSLGVLLYELLTGATPFDKERLHSVSYDELRRIIREEEPPRPSVRLSSLFGSLPLAGRDQTSTGDPKSPERSAVVGREAIREGVSAMETAALATTIASRRRTDPRRLVQTVRGELDWIVMKCLEKDRTRRYETADSLPRDIQRYLDDEPVEACPPSASYRLIKFARRNKVALATVGIVLASLAGGLAISIWQAAVARRAEALAEIRLLNATKSRQQAERAEQRAVIEANRSQHVAHFMKDMLKGVAPAVALGRDTTMLREILEQTAHDLDDLKEQPLVEADLRATIGNVYSDLGYYATAETMLRAALHVRKRLHGDEHPDVAQSLNDLGEVMYRQGKDADAEKLHRTALAARLNLFGNDHVDVAQSYHNLGRSLRRDDLAKYPEAERCLREALRIRRKLLGSEHADVAKTLTELGLCQWRLQKDSPDAEAAHREALAIRRKLFGDEHPDVATSLDRLGLVLSWQRKFEESEKVNREALRMRRKLFGKEHPDLAHSANNLAFLLWDMGQQEEALQLQREAFSIRSKALGLDHPETGYALVQLMQFLTRLAETFEKQNQSTEAEKLYQELLRYLSMLRRTDASDLADELARCAALLVSRQRYAQAEQIARACLVIRDQHRPDHFRTFNIRSVLGYCLMKQGKYENAEPLLLAGYEGLKQRESKIPQKERTARLNNATTRLVEFYEQSGRPAEAAAWKSKLPAGAAAVQPTHRQHASSAPKQEPTEPEAGTQSATDNPPRSTDSSGGSVPIVQRSPGDLDEVLRDAELIYTFETDSIYKSERKSYVRDQSRNGRHGLMHNCVATDGVAGGGIDCTGGAVVVPEMLVNGRSEYTVALWLKKSAPGKHYAYSEFTGPFDPAKVLGSGRVHFCAFTEPDVVWVGAWNRAKRGDWWRHAQSPHDSWPRNEWAFLAVTLRDGGVERGNLTIRINDANFHLPSQQVDHPAKGHIMLGRSRLPNDVGGLVDEAVVFRRALTDAELDTIYRHVRAGRPLVVAESTEDSGAAMPDKD